MTKSELLQIASGVVAKSDREHAADGVLRSELRERRGLGPESSRFITEAVFSYYRWFGWMNAADPLIDQLRAAIGLQDKFDANSSLFSNADLIAKSVPGWIGSQMDITPQWIRTLQSKPPLWLRAKSGQGSQVAAAIGDCAIMPGLPDALQYRGRTDLFHTPQFQAGDFELQDIGSQLSGFVCAPQPGQTWWDACAGEGGKLLHLADLMRNKGLIWASDRAAWRLRKLKKRTARAKVFNYRAVEWNGGAKLPTKTKFDGVLVDAPCTGVGTWQRNPHARWTTTLNDISELKQLQIQLLSNAAAAVKPGGKLIYSVCTLTKGETTEVTNETNGLLTDFEPMPSRHPLTGTERLEHWIWPQDAGGNGMFFACWRRKT